MKVVRNYVLYFTEAQNGDVHSCTFQFFCDNLIMVERPKPRNNLLLFAFIVMILLWDAVVKTCLILVFLLTTLINWKLVLNWNGNGRLCLSKIHFSMPHISLLNAFKSVVVSISFRSLLLTFQSRLAYQSATCNKQTMDLQVLGSHSLPGFVQFKTME